MGKRKIVRGCSDKVATQQIANRLEDEIELRKCGIIDATADRLAACEAVTGQPSAMREDYENELLR